MASPWSSTRAARRRVLRIVIVRRCVDIGLGGFKKVPLALATTNAASMREAGRRRAGSARDARCEAACRQTFKTFADPGGPDEGRKGAPRRVCSLIASMTSRLILFGRPVTDRSTCRRPSGRSQRRSSGRAAPGRPARRMMGSRPSAASSLPAISAASRAVSRKTRSERRSLKRPRYPRRQREFCGASGAVSTFTRAFVCS